MSQSEILLTIEHVELSDFFGYNDSNLNVLRKAYNDLSIIGRGNLVKIVGEKKRVQECKGRIELMVKMLQQLGELNPHNIQELLDGGNPFESSMRKESQNVIVYGVNGKPIVARTRNQKRLVDMSEDHDIVFALGPAGTGKTYTAVALAVRALKLGRVRRIVLTRPAVEAGENLGFLPGDLKEKIDPYLRPLYDGLDEMFPAEKVNQYMQSRVIEVAPLAFMRGRTLDNAFIILDEAQNCTEMQLKMFLTRLGPSAKCIVTGDLSQIDLPPQQRSGLIRTLDMLAGIEGIGILHLESGDVVRHRLVKAIVEAFQHSEEQRRLYQQAAEQKTLEEKTTSTEETVTEQAPAKRTRRKRS